MADTTPDPDRRAELGGILIGAWVAIVGVLALTLGDDLGDILSWAGPVTFVVLGVGLCVPVRRPST